MKIDIIILLGCIVREAQKGRITKKFAMGPQLKKAPHKYKIHQLKTLPECRVLLFSFGDGQKCKKM